MSDTTKTIDTQDDVLTDAELSEVVGGRSIRSKIAFEDTGTIHKSAKTLVTSGKHTTLQVTDTVRKPKRTKRKLSAVRP